MTGFLPATVTSRALAQNSFRSYSIMRFEFDPTKDATNRDKHGLSLERTNDFEFITAAISQDTRYEYAEPRVRALGLIAGRVHVLIFTPRGDCVRVMSLRKANSREVNEYVEIQRAAAARLR